MEQESLWFWFTRIDEFFTKKNAPKLRPQWHWPWLQHYSGLLLVCVASTASINAVQCSVGTGQRARQTDGRTNEQGEGNTYGNTVWTQESVRHHQITRKLENLLDPIKDREWCLRQASKFVFGLVSLGHPSNDTDCTVCIYTIWAKKMHPFYFCTNFVKPPHISIIFGTQINLQ